MGAAGRELSRARWDKRPEEADRLSRVIEVYESAANFGRTEPIVTAEEPTLFDHTGRQAN